MSGCNTATRQFQPERPTPKIHGAGNGLQAADGLGSRQ